jgi:hypothetical protein
MITSISAISSALLIYLTINIQTIGFILLLIVSLTGTMLGARYIYLVATEVNILTNAPAEPVIVYPPPHQKPVEDEDPQPPV